VFILSLFQILESGSPNSLATATAAWREGAWENFVSRVPSCATVANSGNTFNCLRNATTEEIAVAASVPDAATISDFVWTPTLDIGQNSVYPDLASRVYSRGRFAKLPFIAGTNRDEGTLFASQQPLTDEALKAMLIKMNSSPAGSPSVLEATIDKVLELYPADPAVGSPYGTESELFGLPASYKRHASICKYLHSPSAAFLEFTITVASGRYGLRCTQEDVVASGCQFRRQVL
jgi:hypothetical protein